MTHRSSNGFTLIETIAVIVVVGLLAGMIIPVLAASTSMFAKVSETRSRTESASLAMERAVRVLRETASDPADPGAADIDIATASRVRFADGTDLRLDGSTLWLDEPAVAESPLCQYVEVFELTYLGEDGLEIDISNVANLPLVQRLNVRLACENAAELRTSVYLRSALEAL